MFVDSENVNILTALLVEHGVSDAVVCPGSRNAPIVHNLDACGRMRCWPVTDERSAGFFALGLAQATGRPVAVCVTSGTAVLNLAPAVAEAYYQEVPLVVLTADRPEAWIGQLDGQTLPQREAFGPMVRTAVALPVTIASPTDRWHCNRLVNEALLAATFPVAAPVHINVPIAEPLFRFNTPSLPRERVVRRQTADSMAVGRMVVRRIMEAQRPLVVVGQCHRDPQRVSAATCRSAARLIGRHAVWLSERLTDLSDHSWHADEAIAAIGQGDSYLPDLVVYMGATLVSKRLRHFIRRAVDADVLMVSADGWLKDVSTHATEVMVASADDVMLAAAEVAEAGDEQPCGTAKEAFLDRWRQVLCTVARQADDYEPPFSQMAAVRYLEQQLDDLETPVDVHYANSSAIRLANIYAGRPVWCNRGVNGIDGTLSTAAGFAAAVGEEHMVLCVTGDLAFFYDQNALWNQNLGGNLRIVLLNNGEGGIFGSLRGLEHSPAAHRLVSAAHHTGAKGICTQNDVGYLYADDAETMRMGMVRLLTERTHRPMLLEVCTDARTDNAVMEEYYRRITSPVQS